MHTDISVLDMELLNPSSTNNRKVDLNCDDAMCMKADRKTRVEPEKG